MSGIKDIQNMKEDNIKNTRMYYNRTLLRLNRQDLTRRKIVLAASALYVVVYVSFILMQSNILRLSKNQLTVFSNFMDFFALFLCLSFLVVSLYNVFYLEVEKNKIHEKLKKLDQKQGIEDKNHNDNKFADFCDKHGNKVDLLGSIFTTAMQAIAVFSLTIPTIFNCAQIPYGTAFNLQGIVDTVGNILFVISAGMFLCSYLIRYIQNKNKEKVNKRSGFDEKAFILGSLFFGILLVCAGKILLSFEARGGPMYTGAVGPFGMDILPLALIVRTIGMVIFCIGYVVLINSCVRENEQLADQINHARASGNASLSLNVNDIESFGSQEPLIAN